MLIQKNKMKIIYFYLGGLIAASHLTSCSNAQKSSPTEEVSLKADRSYLLSERKDVPAEIRENNDFLALVLKDMSQVKMSPSQVRDRFFKEVRSVRDRFNKLQRQERERFTTEERSKREVFLKELKNERDSFISSKRNHEESKEFFLKQNNQRTAFFENQKDIRKDFESKVEDSRNTFNEEMQMRQKTFEDAYREYQKKYVDEQKNKKNQIPNQNPAPQSNSTYQEEMYPGQKRDLEDLNK